jgi:polyisoprenoid-binding protein YceI
MSDRARLRYRSLSPCLIVLLTLSVAGFGQKPAAAIDIRLDPATTSIRWTLNTTLHAVHGTFKLKSGSFEIDPATGAASGQIVIDATTGESGDSARDKRMHTAVLESAQYPTITFRPSHVSGKIDLTATGTVTVDGILNLHGQDHPMQLTVNLHPQDAGVALATHFSVPFIAWGLKSPNTFILRTGKEVALDVDATAIPAPDSSAHSPARPILHPSEVHSAR